MLTLESLQIIKRQQYRGEVRVLENIDEKTIVCTALHIKAFFRQSANRDPQTGEKHALAASIAIHVNLIG